MEHSDECSNCAGKGHLAYATYSKGDITTVCPIRNGTGKRKLRKLRAAPELDK